MSKEVKPTANTAKINRIGILGLVVSMIAFIVANYINSNFSSSRDTIAIFQLMYALLGLVSLMGFIMTIVATIKAHGLTRRIMFAIATLVTCLISVWLVAASVLVGAFTNF